MIGTIPQTAFDSVAELVNTTLSPLTQEHTLTFTPLQVIGVILVVFVFLSLVERWDSGPPEVGSGSGSKQHEMDFDCAECGYDQYYGHEDDIVTVDPDPCNNIASPEDRDFTGVSRNN